MISVIIPSFNHAHFLDETIGSILNQSYQDFEIIVIDDGSQDNTRDILSKYKDPRVTIIYQENMGAHNAINRGLELSKGEYISILNSDDFFEIDYFETVLNYLNVNVSVDFVSTDLNVVDTNGSLLGIKNSWHNMLPWEITNKDKSLLFFNSYIKSLLVSNFISTTSNMFFRRTILKSVGGMRNLRFVHDWDFALRVAKQHNVYHISKPLVNYRVHGNNTISKNRNWMIFELLGIWATHMESFSNLILQHNRKDNLIDSFDLMMNSFNFQGNDKIAMMLFWQIEHLRKIGFDNPEEIYLEEELLRESIIKHIVC